VEQAGQQEAAKTMKLIYDSKADSVAVLVQGEIGPDDTADVRQLDVDRIVRFDDVGHPIEYQFFNARRLGVRLDDLMHRAELVSLFREAGFPERDWSEPIRVTSVRRRRDTAAG
jgi:hypothetical protein